MFAWFFLKKNHFNNSRGDNSCGETALAPYAAARLRAIDWKRSSPSAEAQQRLAGAVRMRHHPQHVASFAEDPRDVLQRAVGVRLRGQPPTGVA